MSDYRKKRFMVERNILISPCPCEACRVERERKQTLEPEVNTPDEEEQSILALVIVMGLSLIFFVTLITALMSSVKH